MGRTAGFHGDLPLQPTTYLRQVYLDTVVFSYHQLAYLLNVFGPDRILMGTDYPYDMAEYNPVGHIAGVDGMDATTLAQLAGGNAMRVLNSILRSACIVWRSSVHERPLLARKAAVHWHAPPGE